MNNVKKRTMAFVLAIFMILGIMPVDAFAQGLLRGADRAENNAGNKVKYEESRTSTVDKKNRPTDKDKESLDEGPEIVNEAVSASSDKVDYTFKKSDGVCVKEKPKEYIVKSEDFNFNAESWMKGTYSEKQKTALVKILNSTPFVLAGNNVSSKDEDNVSNNDRNWAMLENLKYTADGNPTYCLDMGKHDPERTGTKMYYDEKDTLNSNTKDGFSDLVYGVLKNGYPNYKVESDNALIDNDLFEYATAIAVKIATGRMYDVNGESMPGITKDMFRNNFPEGSELDSFSIVPTSQVPELSKFYNALSFEDKVAVDTRENFVKEQVERLLSEAQKEEKNLKEEKIEGPEELTGSNKPFKITLKKSDGTLAQNINVTVEGANVEFKDADGKVVSNPKNGQEFFINVKDDKTSGEFTIKANSTDESSSVNVFYKSDAKKRPNGESLRGGSYQRMYIAGCSELSAKKVININTPVPKNGTVELTKTDAVSGKLVPNATIKVTGPNGFTYEGKTGSDKENLGKIVLKDLAPGEYTFEETVAPDGYIRSTEKATFTILNNGKVDPNSVTEMKNEPITVVLSKKEMSNKVDGVPGARIEITNKETGEFVKNIDEKTGDSKDFFITDKDGNITVRGIKPGTYVFKETIAPDGYVLNEGTCEFTIDENGKVKEGSVTTIYNARKEFIISKVDSATKNPLANVEFNILDKDGNPVKNDDESNKFVTDINGKIVLSKIQDGKYTLKEIKAPKGYKKMSDMTFEVNKDTLKVGLTVENEPIKASIKKVDAQDPTKVLAGAKFEVRKGALLVSQEVTNEKGLIDLSYLEPGTYEVKEVQAPVGYIADKTARTFTVKDNGDIDGDLVFKNTALSDKIVKVDAKTGKALEGAKFSFFNANGENILNTVSDKDGNIAVTGLETGEYTFKETAAPSGYKADTNKVYKITIAKDGSITGDKRIENEANSITLEKVNKDNNGLEGAKFEVRDKDDKVISTVISDKEGKITINGLAAGKYTLKEIKAPKGYIKSDKNFSIEVLEDGTVTGDVKITNEDTFVKITKVNEDKEKLADAEFDIKDNDGKFIAKAKTSSEGTITIRRLPIGKYILKETKAPKGYLLSDKEFRFEIAEDGKVTGDTEIVNKKADITFTKLDKETKEALSGAKFIVKSGNKEIGKELESDRRGEIKVSGLEPGEYTLVEKEAPKGYIKPSADFKFTVDKDGKLKGDGKIYNSKASITLVKKDLTTGAVLEGASFDIKDNDGKKILSVTTNKNGEAKIDGLGQGKYLLEETVAPKGYIKATKAASFEVDKDGKVNGKDKLEVYNKQDTGKKDDKKDEVKKTENVTNPTLDKSTPATPVSAQNTPEKTSDTKVVPGERVKTGDKKGPKKRKGDKIMIFGVVSFAIGYTLWKKKNKKDGDNK